MLKKRIELIKQALKHEPLKNFSALGKTKVIISAFFNRLLRGTYIEQFFLYKFYLLSFKGKSSYVDLTKLRKFVKVLNSPDKRYIYDDKGEFYNTFRSYIDRDFLDLHKVTVMQIEKFLNTKSIIFIKPRQGQFGIGVSKIRVSDITKFMLDDWVHDGVIIEDIILQHNEIMAFNPDTLNTIRLVTVKGSDSKVSIIGAVFRMGRKGAVADNFHHGGLAANIDISSGTVNSTAIDRNNLRYTFHPDTDKLITGFRIPMWELACDLVHKAAQEIDGINYIGWDVAITNEKVCLIEGNYAADLDIVQLSQGLGMWPVLEPYYKLWKQKQK